MLVETYECQETAAEPIEAAEEAIALINELGLEGQQSLVCKSAKTDRDTRSPYREMTRDERFIYGVLTPSRTKIKDYKSAPIPLRVLQVAAHANSLNEFEHLEVWHQAEFVEKDPVLVGVKTDPAQTWRSIFFILARWGEELETPIVLLKRAINTRREFLKQSARGLTSKIEYAISECESLSDADILACGHEATISLSTPAKFR